MTEDITKKEQQYMNPENTGSFIAHFNDFTLDTQDVLAQSVTRQNNLKEIKTSMDGTSKNTQENSSSPSSGPMKSGSTDERLALMQVENVQPKRIYWPSKLQQFKCSDSDDEDDTNQSLIDHAWSRRILELVGNKAKLMDSFCWLSTVGGGYSALGENDRSFSSRAGALSLGQQLRLAELLGDERLRVLCHLYAAIAALQMGHKQGCWKYIRNVILPLMRAMPFRDPLLTNILRHICFKMSSLMVAQRQNAIGSTNGSNSNNSNSTQITRHR